MLTAVNDATTAALCMQRGALDYLIKPIDLAHLGRAITSALQRRHSLLEGQQINRWLKEEVAQRVAERRLEQATQERISVATLEALVNALEAKDPYLRGHSARVADLSAMVAAQLDCADEEVETVRTAGRLHDIGKIGIREEVLNKQGPLTDEEYEHVKQHTLVGSQILAPLVHLRDVITYVRSHHERWDGFGYPDRLAGRRDTRSAPGSSARSRSSTRSPPPGPTRKRCRPRSPSSACATSSAPRSIPASTGRSRPSSFTGRHSSSSTTPRPER